MEPLIIFVQDEIAKSHINEKNYKRFVPYLLTIFFFIWINNLLGLVPISPWECKPHGKYINYIVFSDTYLNSYFGEWK